MRWLFVKRLSDKATMPRYHSYKAAGIDLHCIEPVVLKSGLCTKVPTHIAIQLPPGHVGLIKSRSSLASNGIHVRAGVIDEDYRGEIQVLLCNDTREDYCIDAGDRIAQLLITPISTCIIQEKDNLSSTTRGDGGFGHTGK